MEAILSYLIERYKPCALLLHGSRLGGTFTPTSDYDFFVITEEIDRVHPHDYEEYTLDLTALPPKLQSLNIENGPIWPLKVVYDDGQNWGERLVCETQKAFEVGPPSLSSHEWENRYNALKRLLGRIHTRGEDKLICNCYLSEFYLAMVENWFDRRRKWKPSHYKALPMIQKEDPEYYQLLQALWGNDYKISAKKLLDFIK